jgi:hypothetical protein
MKMDMKQYAGSESKYLKAADLQGKSVKVTISGVSIVEFEDDDGKKQQKPALELKGKEKGVVCNPTTVQELGGAFGFDSDGWIGKEIGLNTKHYASLGKDGLVVTAIRNFEEVEESDIPF